jgi:hypothetical protein
MDAPLVCGGDANVLLGCNFIGAAASLCRF